MLSYRKEIDGLRALAVLPVILFHAGFGLFDGGYVGVDVFFVISGYLITSIILAEMDAGSFTLAGFYERRARRILPALVVVVLVCLPFAWFWMVPEQLDRFAMGIVAVSIFASNFFFEHEADYFTNASDLEPLIHTWSLAIEEQFYLLFPLFLIVCWALGRRWIAVIVAVTAVVGLGLTQLGGNLKFTPPFIETEFNWFAQPTWLTFFLTPARAWELQLGVLVAFYLERRRVAPDGGALVSQIGAGVGLGLILFAVLQFDRHTPFPGFYTLVPTLGAALIIIYAHPHNLVGRLLSLKPMVLVGLISYSAYLWHQPLFAFARLRHPNTPSAELLIALSTFALLLAYITWRWIERPFRDRALVSRRFVLRSAVLSLGVLVSLGAIGHWNDGFESRFPPEALNALDAGRNHVRDKVGCRDLVVEGHAACGFGAMDSEELVLLVGNSHAGMLVAGLDRVLRSRGYSGLFFSAPDGCASIPFQEFHATEPDCIEHAAFILRVLSDTSRIRHVIVSHRWTTALLGTDFEDGRDPLRFGLETARGAEDVFAVAAMMKESLTKILGARDHTVLVYPVPEAGFLVPKTVFWAYAHDGAIDPSELNTDQRLFRERNKAAYALLNEVAVRNGGVAVYPEEVFCAVTDAGRCETVLPDGSPLYMDNNHLSITGASMLAEVLVKRLR